jgi:PAS domain S-box-containing protein
VQLAEPPGVIPLAVHSRIFVFYFTIIIDERRIMTSVGGQRRFRWHLPSGSPAALGLAVGAVAAATIVRVVVGLIDGGFPPFASYYPAVLLATLVGGVWAGALALALGGIAAWWAPVFALMPLAAADRMGLILYALSCAIIIALAAAYRRVIENLEERDAFAADRLAELEALYDGADVGLALLSSDLRYVRINRRLADAHGAPAAAHIGRTVYEMVPGMADKVAEKLREVLATGRAATGVELHSPSKDHVVLADYYPVTRADGTVAAVGAIVRDITERVGSEKLLRQENERNAILMREVHHRVRNNIQAVWSMLALGAREASTADTREALLEASRRIAAMAAVQQVLYRSDLETVRGDELVDAVIASLEKSLDGPQRVDVQAHSLVLSNDMALPLALVINELVVSAVKRAHGRKRDSPITVRLIAQADEIELSVEDALGFELEHSRRRTSGLGLVEGLARQLGGSFKVERDGGTRCIVQFKGRPQEPAEPKTRPQTSETASPS